MALGKSNTNYRLILTDGEVCVLRLHNPGSDVERENHILQLVRKIVPVPAVLASGGDWSIHSFLQGTTLADAPRMCTSCCRSPRANRFTQMHINRFDSSRRIDSAI